MVIAPPDKPPMPMEVVPTSANDMEIRRLRVPGGWLVFTKWSVKEPPGVPDHSNTMSFFYPDPEHKWDVRSIPMHEKADQAAASKRRLTPALPLEPLGKDLMVDRKGIIWERGKPVGIWGIDGCEMSEKR
jgi:hypothetical protein